MSAEGVLRIAASVILDPIGRMLVVRKTGTEAFMQPGGKLEPGEGAAECLVRELDEELALVVEIDDLEPIGRFTADAANEAGWSVDCDVYRWAGFQSHAAEIIVRAEIAEARWLSRVELDALADGGRLAPLTRDNLTEFLGR